MTHPTGDALRHRLISQLDRLRVCLDGIRKDAERVGSLDDQRCLIAGVFMAERVVGEMEGDANS